MVGLQFCNFWESRIDWDGYTELICLFFFNPTQRSKGTAIHTSPQGKPDPSHCSASVPLIGKLPLCTEDLPAIVLTLCHYTEWRAIERSFYYCLELKSRSQDCSGAKSNLFLSFHSYKVEMIPTSRPPTPPALSICKFQGRYVKFGGGGGGDGSTPDGFKFLQGLRIYTTPKFIFKETASRVFLDVEEFLPESHTQNDVSPMHTTGNFSKKLPVPSKGYWGLCVSARVMKRREKWDQWFQPGAVLPSRKHLTMFGEIFGCHSLEVLLESSG